MYSRWQRTTLLLHFPTFSILVQTLAKITWNKHRALVAVPD